MGCEEYIPSSAVYVKPFKLLSSFLRVLLANLVMLAQKPFLHDTIMRHDVGCRWGDILFGPLEVYYDEFGEEG